MKAEILRISHLLHETYEGSPWHGQPVKQVLQGINAQQAALRILSDTHTMWEIVRHMTAWRNFAFQKIEGDRSFDILNAEQDWPFIDVADESNWQEDLQALENSQQQLLQAINTMEDKGLEDIVNGRQYTFYILLHGIIQHDLYHTGQIALLKKHLKV
ncbi:DinB family protein [Rhodocytophaga rosea]|uniref:DinB family protein n=1 Tax=Rhodocytophaga rosea TaxID=2704465 RepID=A0A6C0GJH9_9BACT|nr:DinB family protein [Rhodocytophaga rosea]QHT68198.1 DinB family protein [Rhodocytophaga rosea]